MAAFAQAAATGWRPRWLVACVLASAAAMGSKETAVVLPLLTARIDAALRLGHQQNFKQVLQQCLAQLDMGLPQYTVLDEQGPDHAKCFEIGVTTGARRFPGAWGPSKKQAEQLAALAALKELGLAAETAEGEVAIIWPKH